MHVLIVDDDITLRNGLVRLVNTYGHTSVVAENARAACKEIKRATFNAVITDVQMPDGNGIDLLNVLRSMDVTPPTYVHSGDSTFIYCGITWELPREIPRYFGNFASFKHKDIDMTKNIAAFLASITA